MSGLQIDLSGITFNTGVPDSDGITWTLDLTAGWWDGPQLDVELLPTISRGSAKGRIMERHRTVVGGGFASVPTEHAHDQAHLIIESGLVPVYTETALVVHERTGARQLMVSAEEAVKVRCHGRAIEFQIVAVSTSPDKTPYPTP